MVKLSPVGFFNRLTLRYFVLLLLITIYTICVIYLRTFTSLPSIEENFYNNVARSIGVINEDTSLTKLNSPSYFFFILITLINFIYSLIINQLKLRRVLFFTCVIVTLIVFVNLTFFLVSKSFVPLSFITLNAVGMLLFAPMWIYHIKNRKIQDLTNVISVYFNLDVYKQIEKNPEILKLGGTKQYMTILFADLKGFTSLSESFDPKDLVQYLNGWLSLAGEAIYTYKGVIDKFMGDCVMAFWNAPFKDNFQATHACEAALDLQARLSKYTNSNSTLGLRIGINTGDVVVGNIGSHRRFDYTVIGDNVNLASRLEGICKVYDVNILLTEHTVYKLAKEKGNKKFDYRKIDRVVVQGKSQPTNIYELMGYVNDNTKDFIKEYEEGVEKYLNGDFLSAKDYFEDFIKRYDDKPAKKILQRCRSLLKVVEGEDGVSVWKGYWELDTK